MSHYHFNGYLAAIFLIALDYKKYFILDPAKSLGTHGIRILGTGVEIRNKWTVKCDDSEKEH